MVTSIRDSYGERAYVAYKTYAGGVSLVSGVPLPDWEDLETRDPAGLDGGGVCRALGHRPDPAGRRPVTEPKQRRRRDWMGASLLLIELVFVLLAVFGVWLMSHPVGYVVAGILGVIAVERVQSRRDEERLHAAVRAAANKVLPKIGRVS